MGKMTQELCECGQPRNSIRHSFTSASSVDAHEFRQATPAPQGVENENHSSDCDNRESAISDLWALPAAIRLREIIHGIEKENHFCIGVRERDLLIATLVPILQTAPSPAAGVEQVRTVISEMKRAVERPMKAWSTGEVVAASTVQVWADELETALASSGTPAVPPIVCGFCGRKLPNMSDDCPCQKAAASAPAPQGGSK
jgi:hypothetical protein